MRTFRFIDGGQNCAFYESQQADSVVYIVRKLEESMIFENYRMALAHWKRVSGRSAASSTDPAQYNNSPSTHSQP